MYCSGCGGLNDNQAAFCTHCGRALPGHPRGVAVAGRGVGGGATKLQAAPPLPRPAGAALYFPGPPRKGDRIELDPLAQCTVGRAADNTIIIDDQSVSRVHACVSYHEGQFLVADLNSRNGTWLNDAVVTSPTPLHNGDILRLGDVELQFQGPDGEGTQLLAQGDCLQLADGQEIPLTGDDLYIGRAPTNDIVFDDDATSRQHARLQHLPQGWLLSDLDSSNGTWVNGQRLSGPVFLTAEDTIAIGCLNLTYHQGGVPAAAVRRTQVIHRRDGALVVASDARPIRPGGAAGPAGVPIVVLHEIVKSYRGSAGTSTVLKGVSLSVQPGEFVAIVGPSGCGKSTLLNIITGIDRPDSGEVNVRGQDILSLSTDALARWRGRNLGIVFQFFQLLPTLTVLENVMLPMAFCGMYRGRERRARAMEMLRLVGMEDKANRLPSALSGGQQQRIAIARALANDAPVLVADEPTGNLDSATSQQMFDLFLTLVAKGKTVLMVTHDPVLARSAGRRVEMLDGAIV